VKSPIHFSRVVQVSLVVATLSMVLGGCGQKGPLYLAKPPERIVRTAPADSVDATTQNGAAAASVTGSAVTPAKK
jgi:predicted small lipoprotein YifL